MILIRLSRWLIQFANLLNTAAVQVMTLAQHVLEQARPTLVRVAILSLVALSLAACDESQSPFGDISKLTVADLTAALARATAADDKPAMMCYPVLIQIVQSIPGQIPDANLAGAVDAFEAARLLAKKAQSFTGGSDQLVQSVNLACAALYNDAKGDILRLGVKLRP